MRFVFLYKFVRKIYHSKKKRGRDDQNSILVFI